MKDYYGVRFEGIVPEQINRFIKQVLGISEENVLHSHFYTDACGDFTYTDTLDLSAYCRASRNIATIDMKTVCFHIPYHSVLCMIYPETHHIMVECCGIAEKNFPQAEIPHLEKWLSALQETGMATNAEIHLDDEW